MIKRRSAIEPIIGHLKNFGRMAKNYLKEIVGDILNPLISAIGLNLRNLANNLTYKSNVTVKVVSQWFIQSGKILFSNGRRGIER